VKSRPIPFSAPMVRALLDGRKTQTRRIVKLPLTDRDFGCELAGNEIGPNEAARSCPHGGPGDLLWVRETWGDRTPGADAIVGTVWVSPWYRADVDEYGLLGHDGEGPVYVEDVKWRPSIHMPRQHSRLTLLIEDVCVERLQDISEADAMAEGVPFTELERHTPDALHRAQFADLWESLNGPEAWNENPWVWVIQFRPIQQNVDAYMREAV